jgi:hypothetical protein
MPKAPVHIAAVAALASSVVTGPVRGQSDVVQFRGIEIAPPGPIVLERIDQGVADADGLAVSLRDMQIDLQTPADFELLYEVPGRDDLMMRIDGALYAVFPHSRYSGFYPEIPENTVFFIGAPKHEELDAYLGAAPRPRGVVPNGPERIELALALEAITIESLAAELRLDLRVDLQPKHPETPLRPATDAGPTMPARIVPRTPRRLETAVRRPVDEPESARTVRYRRVHALLRRAAEADVGRSRSDG